MPNPTSPASWSTRTKRSWREDAVRIVEDLFRATDSAQWDLLIDLRGELLKGRDWNKTFDIFLACREALEADHYLPFYRLRRLMTQSLRLEASQVPDSSLEEILRRKHRSLNDISRAVHREVFEHGMDTNGGEPVQFRLVER